MESELSNLSLDVIIFDFDGTLIDSNPLKYQAYFEVFPDQPRVRTVIEGVLEEMFFESRYRIIKEIIDRLPGEKTNRQYSVDALSEKYNQVVQEGAISCESMPGAESTLNTLHDLYPLYLCSTTPHDSLTEIIREREWEEYFQGIFGYPPEKTENVKKVLNKEDCSPERTVIIGDGATDEQAAKTHHCQFISIDGKNDFRDLFSSLKFIGNQ